MTLSTLKSMNVPMTELTESLKIKPARVQLAPAAPAKKAVPSAKAAPAVDPMQWWGALTNQFAQLATSAMKEGATDAAKALAGGMVKQSFDAAGQAVKKVAGAPGRAAQAAGHASGATKRRRAKPAAKKKQAGDSAAA